jgi:N-acyl-D-amino-acid deacylase
MLSDMKAFLPEDRFVELQSLPRDARSIMEHIGKSALGTNVAFLVGHGTIRSEAMGFADRVPCAHDMDRMKALLAEAMQAGAFGMTSGLIYPPGVYAREDELIELCKSVSAYGGIYATHMRSESDHVVESVEESIRLAENADLPVLISHHKIGGKQNWGKSKETLERIEQANQRALKIRCDQYPYHAGATSLITALPPVYATNGRLEYVNKLKDKSIRQSIRQYLQQKDTGFENLICQSGYDGILILHAPATPWALEKTIYEIANELHVEPIDAVFDLMIANGGDVMAAFFTMCEEDIQRIMKSKYAMGATDAYYTNEFLSAGHPRFAGSFIKILSEYVRDKKIIPLTEAVRKLTSMPADLLGLNSKGILAKGYDADIAILDYAYLRASSDFLNPLAPNAGVKYVIVNGKVALKNDVATGVYAGRILYKR